MRDVRGRESQRLSVDARGGLLLKKITRHRMDIAQIDDRLRVFLASGKKIPTEDKVPPYLVADRLSFQDSGVDEFGRG